MPVSQREFNEFRFERYRAAWDFLSSQDLKVESAEDYLQLIANTQGCQEDISLIKPLETTRHWLARFYPYNQQPILLALHEPKIDLNNIHTNEHRHYAAAPAIPSELAQISIQYYADYLGGRLGRSSRKSRMEDHVLPALRKAGFHPANNDLRAYFGLRDESDEESFPEDIQRQIGTKEGVWNDFYVTNLHLLGQFHETKLHKKPNSEILLDNFVKEIRHVDPEVAILSGNAWTELYKNDKLDIVEWSGEEPQKYITKVHGSLYKDDYGQYYIPLGHFDNRRSWSGEEQRRLEASLEYVAEETSILERVSSTHERE